MTEEKKGKKDAALPESAGKFLQGCRFNCSFDGVKFYKDKKSDEKKIRVDVMLAVTPAVLDAVPDGIRNLAERVKDVKFDEILFATEFENRFISICGRPKGAADVEADKVTVKKVRLISGEKFESVFLAFSFVIDHEDGADWLVSNYDRAALIEITDAQMDFAAGAGA